MNKDSCVSALDKYLKGTKGSYLYLHEAKLIDHCKYENAICFVLAFWSAPAIASLVHYLNFLSQVELKPNVSILILNTDAIPEFYDHPLLEGKIHGWSESFIWQNGELKSENCDGRSLERLSSYLQENSLLN